MASVTNELPGADIIVDEVPGSGVFNMSMDAALLQLAAERSRSVVRIYQWSEPTITLGYFQGSGGQLVSPFPGLPVVRRLSGGGAILHDREITYSLILPPLHPARHDPSSVYEIVHRRIIELLSIEGFNCQLRSEFDAERAELSEPGLRRTAEPFLCFLRKNQNDIVHASGFKIVGSAQRRRKGVTLQHGSIIINASPLTAEVPGLEDLQPDFDAAKFRQSLPLGIASGISHAMGFRNYTDAEKSLATAIASEMN
jgi:lipoate-protein ligase A